MTKLAHKALVVDQCTNIDDRATPHRRFSFNHSTSGHQDARMQLRIGRDASRWVNERGKSPPAAGPFIHQTFPHLRPADGDEHGIALLRSAERIYRDCRYSGQGRRRIGSFIDEACHFVAEDDGIVRHLSCVSAGAEDEESSAHGRVPACSAALE